jgi:hypothetical protein
VRVNEEHWESSYPGNLPLVRSGLADWRDYWTDKKPCSCEQGCEASIVGRKARTKFYGRNLRRASPAKPIKPVPINPSVPGSGVVTTPISALTVKAPLFFMVIVSVPPPLAKTPEIRIETGVTVTVPGVELEKVPLNRVVVPDMMVRVPPV